MDEFMHGATIFIAGFGLMCLVHPLIANILIGALIEFVKDVFDGTR